MQWTEGLAVGVRLIDDQHKELFRRINSLEEAIRKAECKYTIDGTIQFLAEYAVSHFGEEERFMVEHSYPEYEQHREQHKIFLDALDKLKKEASRPRITGSSYDLSVETNRVVVDWIISHIMRVDKKLAVFLLNREIAKS
jgi:hemerythrin